MADKKYVFISSQPQNKHSAKIDEVAALYWLHSHSGSGILIGLDMGMCDYLLGKNDTSLTAIAQNLQEILARELVSIYEVKVLSE